MGHKTKFLSAGSIMANWFEDHPFYTIIGHTALIASLTWVVSSYVIDENKVNLYRAKAENADSKSSQYLAKISVLELELDRLKKENDRYLSWLAEEPKSMPAMDRKIKGLEKDISEFKTAAASAGASEVVGAALAKIAAYEYSMHFSKGESFVDPKTKAVIGVSDIGSDYTARGTLSLPGKEVIKLKGVAPGETWDFEKAGVNYRMTLDKVNWLNDTVKASVVEIPKGDN